MGHFPNLCSKNKLSSWVNIYLFSLFEHVPEFSAQKTTNLLYRVPCKASLDKEASVSRVIFVQSAMCGTKPEHAAMSDSLLGTN